MFEFTLSCQQKNQKLNVYLFNSLKPQITSLGGIVITDCCSGKLNICLAVEDSLAEQVRGILLDAVAEAIVYYYKFDYLSNEISLNIANNSAKDSFIQALVVFDKQTDMDIIKKSLILQNKLVVDSYYSFRMDELKERWQAIANVVMDSIPVMLKDRSVAELTRYFLDSSGVIQKEVNLYVDDERITLEFGNQKPPLEYSANADYQTDLVCEIISLSPQKIIIHGSPKAATLLENALSSVFYGKIYRAN